MSADAAGAAAGDVRPPFRTASASLCQRSRGKTPSLRKLFALPHRLTTHASHGFGNVTLLTVILPRRRLPHQRMSLRQTHGR